jgi:hypothetical protein
MQEGLAGLVFDGIYLDLKYTIDIQPDEIERTVEAISRLRDAVPNPDVIVAMSYDAATVVALSEAGLRAGWKGYPTIEAAEGFVEEGVALGAEMVCIQSISVDATVLDRSAELGIWHLPWESPANIDDALIVRLLDGFAGGLITDIPVAVDSLLADHCGP